MGTHTRHFEKVLNDVAAAGGRTYEARRLADRILHSKSHSSEKMEGTKYFVEPLKLKLLEIFDPRYRPEQFRMNNASVFASDFIFTSAGGKSAGWITNYSQPRFQTRCTTSSQAITAAWPSRSSIATGKRQQQFFSSARLLILPLLFFVAEKTLMPLAMPKC